MSFLSRKLEILQPSPFSWTKQMTSKCHEGDIQKLFTLETLIFCVRKTARYEFLLQWLTMNAQKIQNKILMENYGFMDISNKNKSIKDH